MIATAKYTDKHHGHTTAIFSFDGTKEDFLQKSSQYLLDAAIPGQLSVSCTDYPNEETVFKITKRGTYKENGETFPSMYVSSVVFGNKIKMLPSNLSSYKKRYLTCVHPESNNYKAYSIELSNDRLVCHYGSIDDMSAGKGKKVEYAPDLYWVRYYEKLSKGYIDQTDILYDDKQKNITAIEPRFSHPLYSELYRYASNAVNNILNDAVHITEKQIKTCRDIWNNLSKEKTLEGFNRQLKNLIVLSPRKRRPLQDNVNMYFASSEQDFARIIGFEDNLISAMESKYYAEKAGNDTAYDEGLPIVIEVEEEIKDKILSTLPPDMAKQATAIYKIIDTKKRLLFDMYCMDNHITNFQKLWHGSKNENWLSIIKNGLLLNPNAAITGKMFGNGIYFAPNPKKSYGYTSCYGSYWAHGNMDAGFMGLYDTAVGKPFYPTTYGLHNAETVVKQEKKNCLYAKKELTGLRNDEVVFYNENAICLDYLVKIKSC